MTRRQKLGVAFFGPLTLVCFFGMLTTDVATQSWQHIADLVGTCCGVSALRRVRKGGWPYDSEAPINLLVGRVFPHPGDTWVRLRSGAYRCGRVRLDFRLFGSEIYHYVSIGGEEIRGIPLHALRRYFHAVEGRYNDRRQQRALSVLP